MDMFGKKVGKELLDRIAVALAKRERMKIPFSRIRPLPGQPRTYFDPLAMENLVLSLRTVGQIDAIMVRKVPLDHGTGVQYELINGERRWRAGPKAGLELCLADVIEIDDEAAPYVMSAMANYNRQDHTYLEHADSVRKMREEASFTFAQIASVLGFSVNYVERLYTLRNLSKDVRALMNPNVVKDEHKRLTITAAFEIARLPESHQLGLALMVCAKAVTTTLLKRKVDKLTLDLGVAAKKPVAPHTLRQRLGERLGAIARQSADLQTLLESGDKESAIDGILEPQIEALREKIAKTRVAMDFVESLVVQSVERRK
jgi:ParB family chromosome partitioning protein